jgi:hypothetical protein
MIGLLRQHLPVERLGFLPTACLMQLQRLLHALVEPQGRLPARAGTPARSSRISVDGEPALFVCLSRSRPSAREVQEETALARAPSNPGEPT